MPALYLGPPSGASRCGAAWPGRSWAAAAAVLQGRGGGGQGLSCRGGTHCGHPVPIPPGHGWNKAKWLRGDLLRAEPKAEQPWDVAENHKERFFMAFLSPPLEQL